MAGNITDLTAQVGAAAAAGALAGARINADLVEEETDLLVASWPRPRDLGSRYGCIAGRSRGSLRA